MTCHISNESEAKFSEEAIAAVAALPVLARLEFVRNLIFSRYGSTQHIPIGDQSLPQDPIMEGTVDILDGIIDVLKRHPRAAKLRKPEP